MMVGNRCTILFGIVNIIWLSALALAPSNATKIAQEGMAQDIEEAGGDTMTCDTGQPPNTKNEEEDGEANETGNSELQDRNNEASEHEEGHDEDEAKDESYTGEYYTRSACDENDSQCLTELEAGVWKDGHLFEITDFLECGDITNEDSYVIHKSWDVFRDAYRQVMTKDSHQHEHVSTFQEESGYRVPIVVDYTESIGRGIFADADIAEGTLIWTSANTARFDSGPLYREFLRTLPPNNACDILHWAYTRRVRKWKKKGKKWYDFVICVDLDEGSFTNSCDDPDGEECNMGFKDNDHKLIRGCELEFYALRDVAKGEEIRLNYGDFAQHGWGSLGLADW